MNMNRLIAACFAVVLVVPIAAQAQAQSARRTVAAAPAQPVQKCLKALDGSCTNPDMVEAARLRAVVLSSERVSYFGTPAGTIGGPFISFERLFQDNVLLFGLPTSTCTACVTRRTK
jgi:hypothetical protein